MNKKTLIWVAVIAVVAIVVLWLAGGYNKMVVEQENVETAWGQVENQYQRRMDLIPNVVNTVKGAANYEKSTLEAVVEARAKATSLTIDPSNMTEEQLAQFQNAQAEISQSLSRLLVTVEQYPDLKANTNFQSLITELEGTENRIAIARNTFNDAAKAYNTLIRRFPNNIVAGIFGFEKKPYFKAEQGAGKAPKVDLEF